MKKLNVLESLTSQRVRLDTVKKAMIGLPRSRGASLAFTALEKGRMYIGEMCRELGKEYPYEATKKAIDAKGIQDAVDVSTDTGDIVVNHNEIVSLNILRDNLEKELIVFISITFIVNGGIAPSKDNAERFQMSCAVSEAYKGLKEARMWMGIRLGELRDIEKNNTINS